MQKNEASFASDESPVPYRIIASSTEGRSDDESEAKSNKSDKSSKSRKESSGDKERRIQVRKEASNKGTKRKQLLKVQQSELVYCAVTQDKEDGSITAYTCEIPCPLQGMDHSTAEVLTEAYGRTRSCIAGLDQEL